MEVFEESVVVVRGSQFELTSSRVCEMLGDVLNRSRGTHAFFDSLNTVRPATICRSSCTSASSEGRGSMTTPSCTGAGTGALRVDGPASLDSALDRQHSGT